MVLTSALVVTDGCNIVDVNANNIAVSSMLLVIGVSCNTDSSVAILLLSNCNSELSKAGVRKLLSIGGPIVKGYNKYNRLTKIISILYIIIYDKTMNRIILQ